MTANKKTQPFTAVDNRLYYLQEILSPNAFCLLIRIHRMTEGYGGKPKALSNSFLQKLCNMSKNTVTRAVKELENQQLIHTQKALKVTTIYSVNLAQVYKIYEEIKAKNEQSIPEYDHDDNDDNNHHGHIMTMTWSYYDQDDDKHGHIMGTTKENTIKENLKENTINDDVNNYVIKFDDFWSAYGKKLDTAKCKAKWKKLTIEQHREIMANVFDYVAANNEKQYRKNPLTYLNGQCWLDEIIQRQSQQNNNQVNSHATQQPKQSESEQYQQMVREQFRQPKESIRTVN